MFFTIQPLNKYSDIYKNFRADAIFHHLDKLKHYSCHVKLCGRLTSKEINLKIKILPVIDVRYKKSQFNFFHIHQSITIKLSGVVEISLLNRKM